jgi:hypothetical protein
MSSLGWLDLNGFGFSMKAKAIHDHGDLSEHIRIDIMRGPIGPRAFHERAVYNFMT